MHSQLINKRRNRSISARDSMPRANTRFCCTTHRCSCKRSKSFSLSPPTPVLQSNAFQTLLQNQSNINLQDFQRWAVPSTKYHGTFLVPILVRRYFSKMVPKYWYHGTFLKKYSVFSVFCYHLSIENQIIFLSSDWS